MQFPHLLNSNFILLIICIIASTNLPLKLWEKIKITKEKNIALIVIENLGLLLLFLLSFAYIVASTYNPFLYFRF